MATLSTATDVYSPGVDSFSEYITNRFPTPPSARGFCTDSYLSSLTYDRLPSMSAYGPYIGGALVPEGGYLEPTIGQIWPR